MKIYYSKKFTFYSVLKVLGLGILLSTGLFSCKHSTSRYLFEQGLMQGAMLLKTRPIDEVLRDPQISPTVKEFLSLHKEIMSYAEKELNLETKGTYRNYIELDRPWVTLLITAAHKDKLEPYLFSYPLYGKLPYRGYFNESDARAFKTKLENQNLDVSLREVEAYSSTGWLSDPIINTMFDSKARFIELIFHELVHTQFYFANQADFNEALATWYSFQVATQFVEESQNLSTSEKEEIKETLKAQQKRQKELAIVLEDILAYARKFYENHRIGDRTILFKEIQSRFAKAGFKHYANTDWNNAKILGLATYYKHIPEIESYAKANKLNAPELLSRVIARGPKIVTEILSSQDAKE